MTVVTESITVHAPVEKAYGQWAMFTSFPHFMNGVDSVEVRPGGVTHWTINIGGVRREFDAETVVKETNKVIGWRSLAGPNHAGTVRFDPIDSESTNITADMDIDPEGFIENVADKVGALNLSVKGDLLRFKQYIEDGKTLTSINDPENPVNWPPML